MSIELMTLVWKVPFPTSTQMVIALKLADHAHDDGTKIFPGRTSLAERARCSESTVKTTLKLFREAGLLIVVEEGGKGPHHTTKYNMNVGLMQAISAGLVSLSGCSDMLELEWSEDSGKKGSEFAPLEFLGGGGLSLRGQLAVAKGSAHPPQTIIKHQEPSGARARASDVDTPHALDAEKTEARGWTTTKAGVPSRLVLKGDRDWWTWLTFIESVQGRIARNAYVAEGAILVFDEAPCLGAKTTSLPPPPGSPFRERLQLVRANRQSLTPLSRAMSGERE